MLLLAIALLMFMFPLFMLLYLRLSSLISCDVFSILHTPWGVEELRAWTIIHKWKERRHGSNQATGGAVFWSHLTYFIILVLIITCHFIIIYIYLPYRRIAVSRNCCIPYRRTRIAVSVSLYRCFIEDMCVRCLLLLLSSVDPTKGSFDPKI